MQLRTVEVGASDGALTLISAGLKVGERLVLEGTDKLKEGSVVQVVGEPGALAQPAGQRKPQANAEQKHDA